MNSHKNWEISSSLYIVCISVILLNSGNHIGISYIYALYMYK